jgi:argininosuccinate lyase
MNHQVIWAKPGFEINAAIQHFLAGDDIALDAVLLPYDIAASRAHAQGLARIGLLSDDEFSQISVQLARLDKLVAAGEFQLDARFEDGHSAIEWFLVEALGDAGRKIHTGRSRNDQVLVASRLWLKDQLLALDRLCKEIVCVSLQRAETEAMQPLPGYTHMQRAMVSSCGMWWGAWAEAFIDDAQRAAQTLDWINANPLGSASGFGVNLALDRAFCTEALGFARTQQISTYAQLSRGKFELAALDVLLSAMGDLRRLAWDLSLFSTREYGFVQLPPEYQTGSSLMPNKHNPDLIELLRASYAVVSGARSELEQVLSLPSGYHRDLQYTKAPVLRAFRHGLAALALVPELLAKLAWQPSRIAAAMEPAMMATDCAMDFAKTGVPFREAYRLAADPQQWRAISPEASLQARVSEGAGVNLGLEKLKQRLAAL